MELTASAIRDQIRNARLEVRRLKLLEKAAALEAAKTLPLRNGCERETVVAAVGDCTRTGGDQ